MQRCKRWARRRVRESKEACGAGEMPVRILLGVVVIGIGLANLRLRHPWHRILGMIAIVVGLLLCALDWLRW